MVEPDALRAREWVNDQLRQTAWPQLGAQWCAELADGVVLVLFLLLSSTELTSVLMVVRQS